MFRKACGEHCNIAESGMCCFARQVSPLSMNIEHHSVLFFAILLRLVYTIHITFIDMEGNLCLTEESETCGRMLI